MATVYFYEKPSCANNTRQKNMLSAAGHQVIAKSILDENWTTERLRLFFGALPVHHWFNYSAPAIKYGEINPNQVDENQALELMLEQPLLIRRPLMEVEGEYRAGFEQEAVDEWIGLQTVTGDYVESCAKKAHQTKCSAHE